MAFPASQSTFWAESAGSALGASSVVVADPAHTSSGLLGGGGVPSSAAGTPPDSSGLSLVQIWPQGSIEVSWAVGGAAGRVRMITGQKGARIGGCRGKVRGFTGRSRLRMLEQVNSIKRSAVDPSGMWFVTLTVPSQDNCTWQMIEEYRRAWFKRVRREWGTDFFTVWKKEPHEGDGLNQGKPHLHAQMFWRRGASVPDLKSFRAWNDRAWADVVKSVNPFHQQSGCRVERMRGWNGVTWYCSKYCAKLSEATDCTEETGRIWGIENRARMPVEKVSRVVAGTVGRKIHRALRKLQQRRRERWLIYDPSSRRWRSIAHGWCRITEGSPERMFVDASLVADRARAAGFKVKKWKPKCGRTRTVDVWAQVDGKFLKVGEERHTFLSGLQLIDSATIERVTEYFEREWLEEPPF